MIRRIAGPLAWSLWAMSVAFALGSAVLIVANRATPIRSYFGTPALELVAVAFDTMQPAGVTMRLRKAERAP